MRRYQYVFFIVAFLHCVVLFSERYSCELDDGSQIEFKKDSKFGPVLSHSFQGVRISYYRLSIVEQDKSILISATVKQTPQIDLLFIIPRVKWSAGMKTKFKGSLFEISFTDNVFHETSYEKEKRIPLKKCRAYFRG